MTITKFGDNLLGLDVGTKRVGVAAASAIAKIASPYSTLAQDNTIWEQIEAICKKESVGTVVVGLPRSMDGSDTEQTGYSRSFAGQLAEHLPVDIILQDEALTSVEAERELTNRGKLFSKGDIDSLAASLILEDYIREHLL